MNNPDGTLTVQRQDFLVPNFDPQMHRFALDGKLVPSVTGIIAQAALINSTGYNDYSRERGKAVHSACEYYDEQDLQESILDPEIVPYLEGYKAFCRESGIRSWDLIEQPLADRQGRFCGIVDRVSFHHVVADIKTGAYQPWHRLQLAAYCSMLPEPWALARWAIYLTGDGFYTLKIFDTTEYQTDLSAFISAVNLVNWRAKYGN